MYTTLIAFGWIFTALFGAMILVPWMLGKRHLVTFWSLFLIGSINFLSLGMVQNAEGLSQLNLETETWMFVLSMFLFYGLAAAVYFRPLKRPIGASLLRYPLDTNLTIGTVAVAFAIGGIILGRLPHFPFVQFLLILNGPMSIAAFALSVLLLYRTPGSPLTWLVIGISFPLGLFNVFTYGTGRRELLALLMAIPIVAYWVHFRMRPIGRTAFALVILGSVGALAVTAYAGFRHSDRDNDSSTELAINRIKRLPTAMVEVATDFSLFGDVGSLIDGQNAVHVSLLTIQLTETERTMERDILALPKFILANPIPRRFWPSKPIGLGKILPVTQGWRRVTWGPSVIGHAFYDGGWWTVVLYGLATGWIIRWLDQVMMFDPENPWLIAMFASISGHAIGYSRGDCGTFAINLLGSMFLLYLILNILRILSGMRQRPNSLSHTRSPPVAGLRWQT